MAQYDALLYSEMVTGPGTWWRVTIRKPATGETDVVDVKAATEEKAQSTAMMFTSLQFKGALAEFSIEPIAEPSC